jgi:DNA-binding transcriptional LysR family regulator
MYDWAEFRHFRYLLTILEKRGVRIAAEELNTTQPNLSVQARQFQENASIHLFRKLKGGRIYPTRTGMAFLALVPFLLEARDEIIDSLIAIERNEISTVRLGCTPLADPALFRTFCGLHKELMPKCVIRPTQGDAPQLIQEIAEGKVDAALVTLPLEHPDLRVEELCQDRLVVCLRRDHALASKAALSAIDLQNNPQIFYDPQHDPVAHQRLLELLSEAGINVEEHCRASHPTEMQTLVKEGYGFALIREGAPLDTELTTRPVANVKWTVDTAIVFHRERFPKTIPILIKKLRKQMENNLPPNASSSPQQNADKHGKDADSAKENRPVQLPLFPLDPFEST